MKASRPGLPSPPWPVTLVTLLGLAFAGFQSFLAYQFYAQLKFSLKVGSLLSSGQDTLLILQEGGRLFLGTLWSATLALLASLGLFFLYLSLSTMLRLMRQAGSGGEGEGEAALAGE